LTDRPIENRTGENMLRPICGLIGLIGTAPSLRAAPSPWQAFANGDVERLYQSVVDFHPGMRDLDTPDFAQRVEAAYRTAKDRAQAATSYADWLAATQGFMLSFRDGHTIFRPNQSPARVRWPGFLIDGRAGGWVVRTDDAYFKATTKTHCAERYPTNFMMRGACTRNARDGLRSYVQIWDANRAVPSFNDALKQCYANYTCGDVTDFMMVGACARNQVDGLRETQQ
jgi:hypothetical protein